MFQLTFVHKQQKVMHIGSFLRIGINSFKFLPGLIQLNEKSIYSEFFHLLSFPISICQAKVRDDILLNCYVLYELMTSYTYLVIFNFISKLTNQHNHTFVNNSNQMSKRLHIFCFGFSMCCSVIKIYLIQIKLTKKKFKALLRRP